MIYAMWKTWMELNPVIKNVMDEYIKSRVGHLIKSRYGLVCEYYTKKDHLKSSDVISEDLCVNELHGFIYCTYSSAVAHGVFDVCHLFIYEDN